MNAALEPLHRFVWVWNIANDRIEQITREMTQFGDQLAFGNEDSKLKEPGLTFELVESGLIL